MSRSKVIALLAPLAATLAVAASSARAEHWMRLGSGPCNQDVQALCPSVTPGPGSFHYCLGTLCPDLAPGPGGLLACLQTYTEKLSPACQQHLSDLQAKIAAWKQAFQQACQGDVQAFCGDAGADHRAVFTCLHQHQDELSQTCKDQLAEHHGHRGDDHCSGATPAE
jgi:hypothetical protein